MTATRISTDDAPKYLVWWIPQVPMEGFKVMVSTLVQAKTLIVALGEYDKFQFDHHIKPDYSNAGGVMQWDSKSSEWLDFNTDDGEEIDELTMQQCAALDAKMAANV